MKKVEFRPCDMSEKAFKWYSGCDLEVTEDAGTYYYGGEKIGSLSDLIEAFEAYQNEIPVEDMTNAELLEAAEAEDFWTEEASQELFKRAGIDGSDESTFAELGKSKDRVEPDELFELAKKRLGL